MEYILSSLVDKFPRVSDMVNLAKRRIPYFASEYLFAGTGYDEALENNRKVLNKIFLVPKYLKGTVDPDLKTKLFDYEYDAPFGMAPVGMTSLMWPGAEVSLAKMSVKNNTLATFCPTPEILPTSPSPSTAAEPFFIPSFDPIFITPD